MAERLTIHLLKQGLVVKILMTCMILLVVISFEMIIIIPSVKQDLMVVQQSTAKSHIFLNIPTVSIYMALK